MSSTEIITFGIIKDLIFFMAEYIFKAKYSMKRFEKLHEMVYTRLSVSIEVFL